MLRSLPEAVAQDGAALARFHRAVWLACQISHANVCGGFDTGEAGLPFVTIECVYGKGTLRLRWVGRLSEHAYEASTLPNHSPLRG